MPPRTTPTKSKSVEPVAAVAVAPVVEQLKVEAAKPTEAATKRRTAKAKVAEPIAEVVVTVPEVVVAAESEDAAATAAPVKERAAPPTAESVQAELTELASTLEQQIAQLRDSSDKTGSLKFLRGILRRVKSLQANSVRVMRRKQTVKRVNNTSSGFLKPVKISADIAKFTGLNPSELHSRVDVTKYLCGYIKSHDLQNPEDKRQIIPDQALSKLLGYDAKKSTEPLTYYRVQSLLKPHFIAENAA